MPLKLGHQSIRAGCPWCFLSEVFVKWQERAQIWAGSSSGRSKRKISRIWIWGLSSGVSESSAIWKALGHSTGPSTAEEGGHEFALSLCLPWNKGFNLGCLEATEMSQAALKVLQNRSQVIYAQESPFKLWVPSGGDFPFVIHLPWWRSSLVSEALTYNVM